MSVLGKHCPFSVCFSWEYKFILWCTKDQLLWKDGLRQFPPPCAHFAMLYKESIRSFDAHNSILPIEEHFAGFHLEQSLKRTFYKRHFYPFNVIMHLKLQLSFTIQTMTKQSLQNTFHLK